VSDFTCKVLLSIRLLGKYLEEARFKIHVPSQLLLLVQFTISILKIENTQFVDHLFSY
jgi:hypothetical protein